MKNVHSLFPPSLHYSPFPFYIRPPSSRFHTSLPAPVLLFRPYLMCNLPSSTTTQYILLAIPPRSADVDTTHHLLEYSKSRSDNTGTHGASSPRLSLPPLEMFRKQLYFCAANPSILLSSVVHPPGGPPCCSAKHPSF
jgi:hypothetical protein